MGKRGPKRKPTAILKLHGSRKVEERKNEPVPPTGKPRCPTWIDDFAKQAWRQLVPQLDAMGVLHKIDRNAIIRYCQTWSRWRNCAEFINQNGETYPLRDNDGNVKCLQQWPQVGIYNKLSDSLLRIEQQFGLTPSARAGISVEKKEPGTDKAARFFGGVG